MSTMNITRALRIANEAGISGAEATEIESPESPDQIISAGAEEQTAMGAFKDHQLRALALVCDQDVDAQFLGVRYALVSSTGAGAPGVAHAVGDLEQEIFPNDLIRIEGTVGNDGIYLVVTVVFGADTTITLDNGMDFPGPEGAVGTVARVCSTQRIGYMYPLQSSAVNGEITITGDLTDKFVAGDHLMIQNTVGNDGYWVVTSVAYAAPTTTIVVNAGVLPGAEAVVGYITKVRDSIELTANEPYLWSVKSGQPNPFIHPPIVATGQNPMHNEFRGDVAYCMVNNAGAVNANFDARICKNAIIF